MSSDEEVLSLAVKLHGTYERLAPQYGYETRQETREFDARTPNGRLMIAVCREVMADHAALLARVRELEAKLSDYESAYAATMSEVCEESDDRKHCACVPHLRKRIRELEAERDGLAARLKKLRVEMNVFINGAHVEDSAQ